MLTLFNAHDGVHPGRPSLASKIMAFGTDGDVRVVGPKPAAEHVGVMDESRVVPDLGPLEGDSRHGAVGPSGW